MKRKNYDYSLFDSNYLIDENVSKCFTVENTLKLARKAKKNLYPTAVIVKQELEYGQKGAYKIIKSTIIP
jgi:hypothetical protein